MMNSLSRLESETTTMSENKNTGNFIATEIKKITSPQNALFKNWKSLLTSKGLKDPDFPFCIVSGKKLVYELLNNPKIFIAAIIYSEEQSADNISKDLPSSIQVYSLPNVLFKELDVLGTHAPLLIAEQPEITKWNSQSQPQGLEVILPLGDPSNLGAAIRSATAFGATKIVLTQEAAHPFLPKSIKASSGTVFLCNLLQGPALISQQTSNSANSSCPLEIEGPVVTLDLQGTSIYDFKWSKDVRLLVGEEGQGVPEFKCKSKRTISIPMQNGVESLNANVSLSLALYEFQRSQK